MNKTNYDQIIQELSKFPQKPKLLAVTKYSEIAEINEAIKTGVTMIGENRIESANEKFQGHPLSLGGRAREGVRNVEKHFIGTVQTKKLRKIAELFDVIESIGNIKQLQKVESIGKDTQRKIRIFLQFNISEEEQKSGFKMSEIPEIIEVYKKLEHSHIEGIMGMASQDNEEKVRKQFKKAKEIFEKLKKDIPTIKELSIGMSNDYIIALEEGATIVRIGSKIFK